MPKEIIILPCYPKFSPLKYPKCRPGRLISTTTAVDYLSALLMPSSIL